MQTLTLCPEDHKHQPLVPRPQKQNGPPRKPPRQSHLVSSIQLETQRLLCLQRTGFFNFGDIASSIASSKQTTCLVSFGMTPMRYAMPLASSAAGPIANEPDTSPHRETRVRKLESSVALQSGAVSMNPIPVTRPLSVLGLVQQVVLEGAGAAVERRARDRMAVRVENCILVVVED